MNLFLSTVRKWHFPVCRESQGPHRDKQVLKTLEMMKWCYRFLNPMLFSRAKRAKKCNNKKITQKKRNSWTGVRLYKYRSFMWCQEGMQDDIHMSSVSADKGFKTNYRHRPEHEHFCRYDGFMHMQCELLTGHHHFLILPSECVHFERHCILCLCLPVGHISRHNKLLIPVKSGFHISVIRKILAYQILAKIQYRASLLSSNPVVRLAGVTV